MPPKPPKKPQPDQVQLEQEWYRIGLTGGSQALQSL
jgi:hypothetical protein